MQILDAFLSLSFPSQCAMTSILRGVVDSEVVRVKEVTMSKVVYTAISVACDWAGSDVSFC